MRGSHLLLAPGLGTAGPLGALLGRLARRHQVLAHDPGLGPPAAVLTRPHSRWRPPKGHGPLAWWIDHPAAVPDTIDDDVRLIVTTRPVIGAAPQVLSLGTPVQVAPAPAIDGTRHRPIAPFVRQRWRRRLGLPHDLVVEVGTATARPMEGQTAEDALFLCAAAVVGPGHVLLALALATPIVCDAATAALVGAEDGDVVVAAQDGAHAAAADVARDLERAAALGRRGRVLAEAHHDVAAAARRMAVALDLPANGPPPLARVATTLERLGTPLDAGVVRRAAGACTLGGRGFDHAVQALRW
jgi:hypothetical protein